MKKVIKKAVIPAAGFGTRFLPYTKAMPKEMLNIVDKPAIQYIVEEAVNSGIEDILIIICRNKDSIENHFDKSLELEEHLELKGKFEELQMIRELGKIANIFFVRQHDMNGLGHALLHAEPFIGDEPFAVLLGDDIVESDKPVLKQLMEVYDNMESSIVGVQEVAPTEVSKYGIIDGIKVTDKTYRLNSLVEKPEADKAPSNMAILGRYILDAEIFSELKKTERGVGGEIQLTDAIHSLMKKRAVYAHVFEGRRYDIGDKNGYLQATVEYALKHPGLKESFFQYLKTVVTRQENML